ncbi:hypothetical protein ACFC1R_22110 [Kitasatospora sp. NPDC056138]|uniref:hypothetical protein n=1 Tax=Kitasatospora sp. NPDC056138 TaxID=3345724 RepID=UPI0035D84B84
MNVHELVSALADPDVLRARCRAPALLDVVLDGFAPRYDYIPNWRAGVDLATMENGSGDLYGIVFDPAGAFLYGFDHECDATPWREWPRAHWPGLLEGLPTALAHYPAAPELQFDGFFDATVCAWRETGATSWQCGPVEFAPEETDGAGWLFGVLTDGSAEAVRTDAEYYYERPVDRQAVAALLAGAPLDRRTVGALDPAADFEATADRARLLGYAVADV